ncbi:MAG TPA: flagellar biosynthesis anti-sigma factor FlgM [Nevskiaceae bacterium]|nr:flagellar biosynthesis anti-sigma factor FlgM [Nevskiaceae bacterium]
MSKIDPSSIGAANAAAPIRAVDRGRAQSGAAAPKSEPSDRIEITGDAQTLQALEARVRADSGVDAGKVAEVRRALAEGRYSANAAAIATRLLQAETSLK